MTIGEAIHICRIRRKILQKQLAKKVDISPSLLSMIEKDKRDPGFELTKKIASSLKIPYELLLLLACEPNKTKSKFSKQMKSISAATLEILSRI